MQSQRSHRSSASQAPVWFMRDEDLRVKIALSAQRCADLRQGIKECNPEVDPKTQENLTNQLLLETKRQALLEAELAAPAEAKRALASLRHFSSSEASLTSDAQLLS
ncbi:unnamed protein product [Symbiodinium microadriaticum]|nr:unnamed protein product [Symbiodinium microadriaticum]